MNKKWITKATPYLFILPWIAGLLVFTAGPLILSFVMSFFDWPITSSPKFCGISNYLEMFTQDRQFGKSLIITLKYAAIFVPLNMIIALFLAMLITQPVSYTHLLSLPYGNGFKGCAGGSHCRSICGRGRLQAGGAEKREDAC